MLRQIFVVGLGGALGSILRYKFGGSVLHHTEGWNFPISTCAVNILGCLIIGLLAGVAEHHDLFSPATRLFLFTGLLGGFTTFSAFGYESLFLFRRGLTSVALGYIIISVVAGLVAVWGGIKTAEMVWPARH
jgi:CrcB protein